MEQQEEHEAAGEVDLLLNDAIDEMGFEVPMHLPTQALIHARSRTRSLLSLCKHT
jgi:hypothetical protein